MITRFLRPVLTPCRSCDATCSAGHTHACRGRTWMLGSVHIHVLNEDMPQWVPASWDGRGSVKEGRR